MKKIFDVILFVIFIIALARLGTAALDPVVDIPIIEKIAEEQVQEHMIEVRNETIKDLAREVDKTEVLPRIVQMGNAINQTIPLEVDKGIDRKKPEIKEYVKNELEKDSNFEKWVFDVSRKPKGYDQPNVTITLYPTDSKISRSQDLEIKAKITNKNTKENRSLLVLTLEGIGPNDRDFFEIDAPQKRVLRDKYENNIAIVTWTDIKPFSDLKVQGRVKLRVRIEDEYIGAPYYSNVSYRDLVNHPPEIVLDPKDIVYPEKEADSSTYKQDTKFRALVRDEDGDKVRVTLHLWENATTPWRNFTKDFLLAREPNKEVMAEFSSMEESMFSMGDAGKRFNHSYSIDDEINHIDAEPREGPAIRLIPKIRVEDIRCEPAGGEKTFYWWQPYNFSLNATSPDVKDLEVRLYISKPDEKTGWTEFNKRWFRIGEEPIYFIAKPFNSKYAGKNFYYKFWYSAPDQYGKQENISRSLSPLDPRIPRFDVISLQTMFNLLMIILLSLIGGFILEWRFYRWRF